MKTKLIKIVKIQNLTDFTPDLRRMDRANEIMIASEPREAIYTDEHGTSEFIPTQLAEHIIALQEEIEVLRAIGETQPEQEELPHYDIVETDNSFREFLDDVRELRAYGFSADQIIAIYNWISTDPITTEDYIDDDDDSEAA